MNVLMLSDVYFPRINGVSTSIQTFRHSLTADGINVQLIAPRYSSATEKDAEQPITRLDSWGIPFDPEDRLMRRSALKALPSMLADIDIDIVHIQTPFAAHYTGLKFARLRGVPCIATYHTHFEEYFHHYIPLMPRRMARFLTRQLARQQCNALDAVIVPSSAMRTALSEYGVHRPLHVLPTGIPIADFSAPPDNDFRAHHNLPIDKQLCLFVGRVAHEKNLHFLLHALMVAIRTNPDIHLVIAGEGPALPDLINEVAKLGLSEYVHFLGYLDRENDLPACYAACDLFVFSSLTETQGLVLLEAMAAGLPVLAIPAMGAADIVGPERGAVCAPQDYRRFGELMCELLNDRDRLDTLSNEGQQFVRQWSAPERARELANLYRQLISNHESTPQ